MPKQTNKSGIKPGAGVDPALVEQVKALKSLGYTDPHVAKQLGMSVSTVRRYNAREDLDPAFEEAREKNISRFVDENWKTIHDLSKIVAAAAKSGDYKPKDAAVTQAVLIDKIAMLTAGRDERRTTTTEKFEVNVTVMGKDEPEHNGVGDAGGLHVIDCPVQGDDLRGGSGENVHRLRAGGGDGPQTEVRRGDSSIDIQEPSRLRDPDADPRTVGSGGGA